VVEGTSEETEAPAFFARPHSSSREADALHDQIS
jgi:hypothetical protein